jgi:hypothetical protein
VSALLTFPPDAAAAFDGLERRPRLLLASVYASTIRSQERPRVHPATPDADIVAAALRWMPNDTATRDDMVARCRRGYAAMAAANPDATPVDVLTALSTRLHNGDLVPRTAEQQAADLLLFRCHRALNNATFTRRITAADAEVMAELERRGWAVAGTMTPQGEAARDAQRRANARWRRSRPAARDRAE